MRQSKLFCLSLFSWVFLLHLTAYSRVLQEKEILPYQDTRRYNVENDPLIFQEASLPASYLFLQPADTNRLVHDRDQTETATIEYSWIKWTKPFLEEVELKSTGAKKMNRPGWILAITGLLLLLLSVVRLAFPSDFHLILEAPYNDRLLAQINKEYNLYSSWPFVFLYILFAAATGLFIYLVTPEHWLDKSSNGFNQFLWITLFIFILFTLKIICTRLIGYIFDLQKVVREYVSVLYISYFHVGLLFLIVGSFASLTPPESISYFRILVWLILLAFFAFRLGKTFLHLLQTYKLSVFYLFVYLCILEIAPILILINVLSKN
jgi:hypothetical protein